MTDLTGSLSTAHYSRTLRLPRLPSLGLTKWLLTSLTACAEAQTDAYLTALGQFGQYSAAGRKREHNTSETPFRPC